MDRHDGMMGKVVLEARPGRWGYLRAVLVGLAVWIAARPLLDLTEPLLLTASARLRGVTAASVRRGLDLFILAVRLAAFYATLAWCWRAAFCRFLVRDKGVELVTGFFRQNTTSVASDQVRSVTVSRSLLGRWLGYGDLLIDHGASEPLACRDLPRPESLASRIPR